MEHRITKKGQIQYDLWTIMWNMTLKIEYTISEGTDTVIGVGTIKIKGDGERPKELDDQEVMMEIVSKCMEDWEQRKSKQKESPSELNKIPGTDWGMN